MCTGNSAYRAEALRQVGLFDETFGYGYDNDLSYRLRAAGYRLIFCREAQSVHRWREGLSGYLVQQYGFGYGRIDLVAKHPGRVGGDSVSPAGMMSHPLLMAIAVLALGERAARRRRRRPLAASGAWRGDACSRALRSSGWRPASARRGASATLTPLVFPLLHLGRDLAWVAAIAVWLGAPVRRPSLESGHSMRPRAESTSAARAPADVPQAVTSPTRAADGASSA